jgi:predicted Holliday junction resolvase-like endonuclease
MDFLLILLALFSLLLLFFVFLLYQKAVSLQSELRSLQFSKDSQSVKYGKMTEHWIPFAEQFPFSAERFRFIGNPIDGIVFEDEKIVFCEFKSSSSQLNENQKRIKRLVEEKRVDWLEFRIK